MLCQFILWTQIKEWSNDFLDLLSQYFQIVWLLMSFLRTLVPKRNLAISSDQDQRKILSIIIRIKPVFLVVLNS